LTKKCYSKFLYLGSKICARTGGWVKHNTKSCISALPRFQYLVFLFLMPAPPKSRQKIRKHAKRIFAKYFPPNPQHFAKFRSRSAFSHSTSFAPKTLWRSAERFSALLLLQKLCASHRGASARGERLWIFSRIFDKVSSSGIVKPLQNPTFWLGTNKVNSTNT